jgi:hypothetical protein
LMADGMTAAARGNYVASPALRISGRRTVQPLFWPAARCARLEDGKM